MDLNTCPLCHLSVSDSDNFQTIKATGKKTLDERGVQCILNQRVHIACRKTFSKKRKVVHETPSPSCDRSPVKTRCKTLPSTSSSSFFDIETCCLFCGDEIGKYDDFHAVRTLICQESLRDLCVSRNDGWALSVLSRIEFIIDLPAAGAVYHSVCNTNFRTGKNIPAKYNSNPCRQILGRPVDEERKDAFMKIVSWFENSEDERITLRMMSEKMSEITDGNPYSSKYLRKKLDDYYKGNIKFIPFFSEVVVVLVRSTDAILKDFYRVQRNTSPEAEKIRIIETAAKMIRNDIKLMEQHATSDTYPTTESLGKEALQESIPKSIFHLLRVITDSNHSLKLSAIGQCIVQATRPRTLMMPLPLYLSVHLHDHFSSRYVVDILESFGFAKSYSEVRRFQRNAAMQFDQLYVPAVESETVQFVADNVDDTVANLDGKNTPHYMGMIAVISPCLARNPKIIPRKEVTAKEIGEKSPNLIMRFNGDGVKRLGELKFLPLNVSKKDDPFAWLNLLYKTKNLSTTTLPFWSGFMKSVFGESESIQRSSVVFLPMIPLSPTDDSCVYSTLKYIENVALKSGVVPTCTFDQALWWKALQVLRSKNVSFGTFVLRLGGFHTIMSFLGCIGHIMAGSGLREAFETIYAADTVAHILSGKAVYRAIRAHLLLEVALYTLLLDGEVADISEALKKLLTNVLDKSNPDEDELKSNVDLKLLKERLDKRKSDLSENQTSSLWFIYLEMVDLLKRFITAERLGRFFDHQAVLKEMLPFFASCAHNNYTKSVWLYLQMINQLKTTDPDTYGKLVSNHTIRRTDKQLFAGISLDQVIEQTLMRSLKSEGGLSRGTGYKLEQRNTYLFSRTACAEVSFAMQEVSGKQFSSTKEVSVHKYCGLSRVTRDNDDCLKLQTFLQKHNPFLKEDLKLMNIVSGVIANDKVSVNQCKELGAVILKKMENKVVADFKFKLSWCVVNMVKKIKVTTKDGTVLIDPQLLFQRLTAILLTNRNSDVTLEVVSNFSLCPYPAALFSTIHIMLSSQKPKLLEKLLHLSTTDFRNSEDSSICVLDGGYIMHKKVFWQFNKPFGEIAVSTAKTIKAQYGSNAVVVFDGYPEYPTTKDHAHHVRAASSKQTGAKDVNVDPSNRLVLTRDQFLSRTSNKKNFIVLLAGALRAEGIQVHLAEADADLLIATTAVDIAKTCDVTVIGEDTDLVVLLWHYMDCSIPNSIVLQTESRVWHIRTLVEFGHQSSILLIHAFFGCDTVSRIFSIGKGKVLQEEKLAPLFEEKAKVFYDKNATKEAVQQAGEVLMLSVFRKVPEKTLGDLRAKMFSEKVKNNTYVKPQSLPPTSDAACFHSLRVFHTIQDWLGNKLDPRGWGWVETDNKLTPVMMTKEAAPEYLLKYIHCSCKADGCHESSRCSCRKHGVQCTLSCTNCNGTSCQNASTNDVGEVTD